MERMRFVAKCKTFSIVFIQIIFVLDIININIMEYAKKNPKFIS